MNRAKLVILAIIVITFMFLIYRTHKSCYAPPVDDNHRDGSTVYGTDTCPHCINLKNKYDSEGVKYTFVDCNTTKCPDFVDAYPTIQFTDGTIKVGDS